MGLCALFDVAQDIQGVLSLRLDGKRQLGHVFGDGKLEEIQSLEEGVESLGQALVEAF
jgi:hypothetical protein